MRIVPINEAEAIVEPYWDGGSSEHPTDKYSLLEEYLVTIAPDARARVYQQWHCVIVEIDRAAPGEAVVVMERPCDIVIDGYDIFRAFFTLPSWMRVTISGVVDGHERVILDGAAGVDTNEEYDAPISGRHLTYLTLSFSLTEPRSAQVSLFWLGLSNQADQARMEARHSPYTPDWPGALAQQPQGFAPEIGIFFGPGDLDQLRAKLLTGHLAPAFTELRAQAEKDMRLNPEAEVGRLVPWPLRIFGRKRDLSKTMTAGIMERLAFVGLIDQNLDMSVMAARMALSAAHCEHWCESPMGVFPGATWHHRSFTEEVYARACALALDWAGFCLTLHGKQIVRDAIIMKGLPRMESDFKRMEYIRHMNQGIVFSSGRIIGALSLLPAHPRYRRLVEEAERDLHEMIDDYVRPDGGTLEGIAYWNYTFSTSMPVFYALARYHGQSFKAYATPSLIRTGDYALGMLSITGDGTTYLPVNDAHADQRLSRGLVAAYCRLSDRPEWPNLYATITQGDSASHQDVPDLYDLILAPSQVGEPQPLVQPKFAVFPDTGQVSSVRHTPALGHVHFHLCSGPAFWGHFDEDKGSFILEAGDEALAIDRGVCSYDHAEATPMGFASRHNLLYPEKPDGAEMHQPTDAFGGTLTSALDHGGIILLASDQAQAWAPGLFATNIRRVFSPVPELYLLDDEVVAADPLAVSFLLHSTCPLERRSNSFWVRGAKASLRVTPLNWSPAGATIDPLGFDSHLKPVNVLRLTAEPAMSHRLLTALEIVPNDAGAENLWRYAATSGAVLATRADWLVMLTPGARELRALARRLGQAGLTAACKAGTWQVEKHQ